jgi:phage/plasmid-like protein (TIGR03299 family)
MRIEKDYGENLEQLLDDAGLNFTVRCEPFRYSWTKPDGTTVEAKSDKRRVLFREDTGQLFDCPGVDYRPHQNLEVLQALYPLVRDQGMKFVGIGSFEGGRRMWVQIATGERINVSKKGQRADEVEALLLFYNPHVYGEATFYKPCMTRISCWNTILAAREDAGDIFRLTHSSALDEANRGKVATNLLSAHQALLEFKEDALKLVAAKLTDEQVQDALRAIGKPNVDFLDQPKLVHDIYRLYKTGGAGSDLPTAQGTAWGVFNAVTEFVDHRRGNAKTTEESRLQNAWSDSGNNTKRKALESLLKLAA